METMKSSQLKTIGIVLLATAVMTAALIQALGSGLVVIEPVQQHVQTSDPRVMLAATVTTAYHVRRMLPLLATAFVGVLFRLVSRRHKRPAA